MPIVVVNPMVQRLSSLQRTLVDEAVSPFTQGRLDEAFGLAAGLRSVRSGEPMSDVQFGAGAGEVPGAEWRAIVGQQTLDGHAQ